MNNAPIGVFDSGLGGLTVWKELRRGLPAESIVYFGDGKNCPYGPKPVAEVIGYAEQAVRLLLDQGAKLIVVACNAATAAAIDYLRTTYDLPFVGMEPAVKPAALSTRSGVIGILATRNTLKGHLFRDNVARYGDRVRILEAVGEGFVEIVEADLEQTPKAEETVRRVVEPMLNAGADRIVLGCTHYPFLAPVIRRVIGDRQVELVDPAPAVERRVAHLLTEFGLQAEVDHQPQYSFFTAAGPEYRTKLEAKSRFALTMI